MKPTLIAVFAMKISFHSYAIFLCEKLCTKPRFHNEVQSSLEMTNYFRHSTENRHEAKNKVDANDFRHFP